MKEVDFSNWPDKSSGGGNGITFLRFESGKTCRLRPFGSAVEFVKLFIERGKPSIIVDPDDKDAAAKLLTEHAGREIKPSYRCAMFVLDRGDDNKVKILEGGHQIFEAFANWTAGSGIRPGSGQGGDWQISVTGDGVGGSNPRKYSPVYLGPQMFTDDEKKMISGLKEEGKLKLGNYLKEIALKDVLETAFGVVPSAATTEPAMATAAAGAKDDDMDW